MSVEMMLGIVAAGVCVGILSALFGIGGGLLMVPFMVLVLDKGQHLAEGTSLLVIVPTAIAGVLIHRRNDYVVFKTAALLGLGGAGGAYLGAALALRLSAGTLESVFGLFMLGMGARTTWMGTREMRAG
jgi:uncharacterized membrane protein YfcA